MGRYVYYIKIYILSSLSLGDTPWFSVWAYSRYRRQKCQCAATDRHLFRISLLIFKILTGYLNMGYHKYMRTAITETETAPYDHQ